MKSIMIYLALATALFAAEPAAKETKLSFTTATLATGKPILVELPISYDIVWTSSKDAGRLLSINGIRGIIPLGWIDNSMGHVFVANETSRPEKPEEIKAELWTKDGRYWRAKWEEVKP